MLDSVVKQRMVGALVLVALAVIFLPMLFSRPDEVRRVRVDAPAAPQAPSMPQVRVEPVEVPVNQPVPSPAPEPAAAEQPATALATAPAPAQPPAQAGKAAAPAAPAKPIPELPAAPVAGVPAKPDSASKIDPNGVPLSWAVQLASLSTRASADALQGRLRTQGYNAYVRSADGKNRVFVGPVIERAEAERLRDTLNRQQQMKGFVVRFEP
ncbi:SPOR domain-containing protein [Pseudomonas typographi]|uniref:SPOR domain-containing protein n=1 Tax=Pseudomonas typographi TaxID=2715964 RepID=A0ABR7YYC6_9PSED|nr:SPOR domain-containing protein [Pseudomonas typographi]MBD1550399.1 SPOR domain-containing protein [Pseudomonas typographi]MBD1588856.1 SPOR domain-containing protein [Pseudomonas typographi]MBD1598134.1 SPOR domain-containing protein [Pseudomonas typographi]